MAVLLKGLTCHGSCWTSTKTIVQAIPQKSILTDLNCIMILGHWSTFVNVCLVVCLPVGTYKELVITYTDTIRYMLLASLATR